MSAVELPGLLVCRDTAEAAAVRHLLPRHVELTRAESGCDRFDVLPSRDPLVWSVMEAFADQGAYAAHQERVRASEWGRGTAGIARRYAVRQDTTWRVLLTDLLGDDLVTAVAGEYAFPGPLRDALVAAILAGEKTATAALLEQFVRAGEPLPQPGELEVVLSSQGRPVGITRTTGVRVERFGDVTDAHAVAEGEGFVDAAAWRAGHHRFWTSDDVVRELGEPPVVIDDDTSVVLMDVELLATL